jgi:hypothetical protein
LRRNLTKRFGILNPSWGLRRTLCKGEALRPAGRDQCGPSAVARDGELKSSRERKSNRGASPRSVAQGQFTNCPYPGFPPCLRLPAASRQAGFAGMTQQDLPRRSSCPPGPTLREGGTGTAIRRARPGPSDREPAGDGGASRAVACGFPDISR